jgi:PAS domain-containing protein
VTVLDNIRACVYLKTPDGRYLYANQALGELLQRPPARLIGLRDEDIFPPEAGSHFRHLDAQAAAAAARWKAWKRSGLPTAATATIGR